MHYIIEVKQGKEVGKCFDWIKMYMRIKSFAKLKLYEISDITFDLTILVENRIRRYIIFTSKILILDVMHT